MAASEGPLTPAEGWIDATPPIRLPDAAAPWLRALFWAVQRWGSTRSTHSQLPRVMTLLAQHRRLFWPWLRFAARLMPFGTLHRHDTELAILRVAWNARCRYEWGQHVLIALAEGVPADQIARVARGPEAPGWSQHHAALLRAADELHGAGVMRPSTMQQLQERYDTSQLVELTMLIGHYQMLAGVINSFGLALEPEIEEALARAPIQPGRDTSRSGIPPAGA